ENTMDITFQPEVSPSTKGVIHLHLLLHRPRCHPIADGLPTRKPSETSSSPVAQGNPRQLLTCRELDGRTSAAKAFRSPFSVFSRRRGNPGTISLSSSSRFPWVSLLIAVNPVTFPPGRARLNRKPGADYIADRCHHRRAA